MATQAQVTSLKKQKAFAWAMYFAKVAEEVSIAQLVVRMVGERQNGELVRPDVMPSHISDELWEMANKLNKTYTCPICYDLTNKETFHLTWCGHILCKDCYNHMTTRSAPEKPKCPMCRKGI